FNVSVPRLGRAQRVPGLRGAGGGDGVLRVALASLAAPLAVGAIHLDHRNAVGEEVAGEAGSVAARALYAHQLHVAEVAQPAQRPPIAPSAGLEALYT